MLELRADEARRVLRAAILAVALASCARAPAMLDAGAVCDPAAYRLCIIAEPPLPPALAPWHCTDGAARGRAWCAVCDPPGPDYCAVLGAPVDVVCVASCAACQVPSWPACRPEWADDLGVADLSGGWSW